MRLNPGVQRALSLDRRRSLRRSERTAVLPGRRPDWRPPVRLTGLLDMALRPKHA